MKRLLISLLLLSAIFSCGPSYANILEAILLVGIGRSVIEQKAFERFGSLGARYGWETWKIQANCGYWLTQAQGEKASLFTSIQGGVEVGDKDGLFSSIMVGPALIQHPDSKLSGHFQFHSAFGIGTRGSGHALSFVWQHFSNAGIKLPNMGRDLLTLQLAIPLWGHK